VAGHPLVSSLSRSVRSPVAAEPARVAWMRAALLEAEKGAAAGEIPVGAVVISPEGKILARAHNRSVTANDPTAHAEILALRGAARKAGNYRLTGCRLVVTLEPCPMCAGALVMARLDRLVYGCADPKAGACGSLYDICRDGRLNHRLQVTAGVLAGDCADLLQAFFRRRRPANGSSEP